MKYVVDLLFYIILYYGIVSFLSRIFGWRICGGGRASTKNNGQGIFLLTTFQLFCLSRFEVPTIMISTNGYHNTIPVRSTSIILMIICSHTPTYTPLSNVVKACESGSGLGLLLSNKRQWFYFFLEEDTTIFISINPWMNKKGGISFVYCMKHERLFRSTSMLPSWQVERNRWWNLTGSVALEGQSTARTLLGLVPIQIGPGIAAGAVGRGPSKWISSDSYRRWQW